MTSFTGLGKCIEGGGGVTSWLGERDNGDGDLESYVVDVYAWLSKEGRGLPDFFFWFFVWDLGFFFILDGPGILEYVA